MNEPYVNFVLPLSVLSKVDVSRLVNELERVDNEQTQATVREKVASTAHPELMISRQFADFLNENKLTIATSQERAALLKQLRLLKEHIPVIHMTFAVNADRDSLAKLTQWLRTSISAQAVIEVGLQPALIAGVSVRTPNHIHDLSMREVIKKNHGLLVKELEVLRGNR
jgi:F0F1-type ATP synthase delta subunit